MKCLTCGEPVSEQEMRDRYDELCKQGIIPMMVPMCKNCRENPRDQKKWSEWRRNR